MVFKRKEITGAVQIKAYKFRIFPEHRREDFPAEIKQAIFQETRRMSQLWNRLVEMRKAILEEYNKLYTEELKNIGESRKKISFKELSKISSSFAADSKALWQRYDLKLREINNNDEIRSTIPWEIREDIFRHFETAHKQALKDGGELKFQPTFVKKFHFYHRFTGGGLDSRLIHSKRSTKISIERVPDEFYADETYQNRLNRVTNGRFGIGMNNSEQIPFRIVMHRQIPAAAKIKTAVLTGKLKNHRWIYHLILTIEESPIAGKIIFKKKIISGLNVGWRKFEDYIRFGILADSAGNIFEFRLPINPNKKQSLRRLEKMLAKHGKANPKFPQNWEDLKVWQARNDLAVESIKKIISEFSLPQTETIKSITENWEKIRKGGLLRILKALEELESVGSATDDATMAIGLLNGWKEESFTRQKAIDYTRERLINFRNYSYQNLAKWLKENYTEIVYSELIVQKISETPNHDLILEKDGEESINSEYRLQVALFELLRWIKQKDKPDENWLHQKDIDYWPIICSHCDAACQKFVNHFIICTNGHQEDLDVQTAINLKNDLFSGFQSLENSIIIPEQLKEFIVKIE